MSRDIHIRHMTHALRLAEQQLGCVAPNPAVGCIIVKEGHVVGVGVTAKGGRPHAETQALHMAGDNAKDATLYVSLEPCNHHGETPPCSNAIVTAGVKRVVVACTDPDPRVAGSGIEVLRNAGIEVVSGVLEEEARQLNRGFINRITNCVPLISMKIATSLDGMIALGNGESQWITSEPARNYGHYLRATHDAIMTGIGTVLADNPSLTCRLSGRDNDSPISIILDRELRIPLSSELVKRAQNSNIWVVTKQDSLSSKKTAQLEGSGVRLLSVEEKNGMFNLQTVLTLLAKEGITRLMLEAGPNLSTAMLKTGLVHDLYWFRGPIIIGNDTKAAIGPLQHETLSEIRRHTLKERISLGEDTLDLYEITPCLPESSQI